MIQRSAGGSTGAATTVTPTPTAKPSTTSKKKVTTKAPAAAVKAAAAEVKAEAAAPAKAAASELVKPPKRDSAPSGFWDHGVGGFVKDVAKPYMNLAQFAGYEAESTARSAATGIENWGISAATGYNPGLEWKGDTVIDNPYKKVDANGKEGTDFGRFGLDAGIVLANEIVGPVVGRAIGKVGGAAFRKLAGGKAAYETVEHVPAKAGSLGETFEAEQAAAGITPKPFERPVIRPGSSAPSALGRRARSTVAGLGLASKLMFATPDVAIDTLPARQFTRVTREIGGRGTAHGATNPLLESSPAASAAVKAAEEGISRVKLENITKADGSAGYRAVTGAVTGAAERATGAAATATARHLYDRATNAVPDAASHVIRSHQNVATQTLTQAPNYTQNINRVKSQYENSQLYPRGADPFGGATDGTTTTSTPTPIVGGPSFGGSGMEDVYLKRMA